MQRLLTGRAIAVAIALVALAAVPVAGDNKNNNGMPDGVFTVPNNNVAFAQSTSRCYQRSCLAICVLVVWVPAARQCLRSKTAHVNRPTGLFLFFFFSDSAVDNLGAADIDTVEFYFTTGVDKGWEVNLFIDSDATFTQTETNCFSATSGASAGCTEDDSGNPTVVTCSPPACATTAGQKLIVMVGRSGGTGNVEYSASTAAANDFGTVYRFPAGSPTKELTLSVDYTPTAVCTPNVSPETCESLRQCNGPFGHRLFFLVLFFFGKFPIV